MISAVLAAEFAHHLLTGGFVEFDRALDDHLAAFEFEAGETLEGTKDGVVVTRLLGGEALDDLAQTILVQTAVDLTQAEESAGGGGGGFGDLHGGERSLIGG